MNIIGLIGDVLAGFVRRRLIGAGVDHSTVVEVKIASLSIVEVPNVARLTIVEIQ